MTALRSHASRRKVAVMGEPIYKVLTAEQWSRAEAGGPVAAPVDEADGYVHFSTAAQLQSTLDKWFMGVEGCVLAEFDAEEFAAELKWEKARGAELFPHVYGRVHAGQARSLWLLEMGPNGAPLAPEEIGRRAPIRPRPDVIS